MPRNKPSWYYKGSRDDRLAMKDAPIGTLFCELAEPPSTQSVVYVMAAYENEEARWTEVRPSVPCPTICRMVIYTDYEGREHPAVVHHANPTNLECTLVVFSGAPLCGSVLAASVVHADPPAPRSWRWPPRA